VVLLKKKLEFLSKQLLISSLALMAKIATTKLQNDPGQDQHTKVSRIVLLHQLTA